MQQLIEPTENACCFRAALKDIPDTSVVYAKPKVVGEYSVTTERDVVIGRKNLRLLNESLVGKCNINLDLCDGYENFVKKDDVVCEALDPFLKWISASIPRNVGLKEFCDADIVCNRGLLKKVASFPYGYRDHDCFHLVAVKFRSVIFMYDFYTEKILRQLRSPKKMDDLLLYYGFHFEKLVTLPLDFEPNNVKEEPVNNCEQFFCVSRTTLETAKKKLRILLSAEVDCINSSPVSYQHYSRVL
uniref:Decapping nuclease n=1 Tax=Syphacia muris TaxID=451379 RepID=A0A0N5ACS0_9BILA